MILVKYKVYKWLHRHGFMDTTNGTIYDFWKDLRFDARRVLRERRESREHATHLYEERRKIRETYPEFFGRAGY